MRTIRNVRNRPPRRRILVGLARCLPFLALAVSAYLTWITWTGGTIAGCDGEATALGCDPVLTSRWARWLGMPVAPFGLLVYGALAGLRWLIGNPSELVPQYLRSLWRCLMFVAAGSGLWFVALQVLAIGKFCPYCLVVHACGLLLAILWMVIPEPTPARRPRPAPIPYVPLSTENSPRFDSGMTVAAAAVALAGLIVGQILFPGKSYVVIDAAPQLSSVNDGPATGSAVKAGPSGADDPAAKLEPTGRSDAQAQPTLATFPPATQKPQTQAKGREIAFLGRAFTIHSGEHPIVGSPDATAVGIEMMDYTCDHCRELHRLVKQAKAHYGDRVALLVLPCPLSPDCNPGIVKHDPAHAIACPLAKLAIAVWKTKREEFPSYHDWLMERTEPPSLQEATAEASRRLGVGHERLQDAMNSKDTTRRIKIYTSLFSMVKRQNAKINLPLQLIGRHYVVGVPDNEETAIAQWRELFPLP